MRTLDRHLVQLGLRRWAMVLFLGTFLILLGDFIGQLGSYLTALGSRRWWIFFLFEGVRLPGFLLTWLPLSALVAAMLTAMPLINQGTLTALGSSGIAPGRVFRPFVVLALFTGLASFALTDQVVTRLSPFIDRVELAMEGKGDLRHDRARASGWRSGASVWSATSGRPEAGVFTGIAAFRADESRRMLTAERLEWTDSGWLLSDVLLIEGEQQRSVAGAAPKDLGFDLRHDRERLADALRADDSRTSGELRAAKSKRRHQILCVRIATALLPLLCLLYGFPGFVRWNDRTRLAVVGFQSLLWAMVPLLAVGLLGKLLVSAGAQPVYLALGVLGATFTGGVVRWRRMRL